MTNDWKHYQESGADDYDARPDAHPYASYWRQRERIALDQADENVARAELSDDPDTRATLYNVAFDCWNRARVCAEVAATGASYCDLVEQGSPPRAHGYGY